MRTNAFLRSINALRNLSNDIKDLSEKPTISKLFWTLIQLTRTYNSLRRLVRLTFIESNAAASFIGIIGQPTPKITDITEITAPTLDFSEFDVRVDAFMRGESFPVDRLDLSDLPQNSRIMIQAILEEDADITVNDAKMILTERILHPEESTGDLAASIYWEPQIKGTRIVAGMPYAWWVELGHDNFGGHRYLLDSTQRARLRLREKILTQVQGLLMQDDLTL